MFICLHQPITEAMNTEHNLVRCHSDEISCEGTVSDYHSLPLRLMLVPLQRLDWFGGWRESCLPCHHTVEWVEWVVGYSTPGSTTCPAVNQGCNKERRSDQFSNYRHLNLFVTSDRPGFEPARGSRTQVYTH